MQEICRELVDPSQWVSRRPTHLTILFILIWFLSACQSPPPIHVLVVTFDTTRADYLGSYGNTKIHTPALDQLAQEGVLFERALAPVPITLPSHASLMTGKVPFAHGIRDNGLFVLAEEQTTLAEILRQHGYRTAAAIGAYPLRAQFGLNQGFELFDDHLTASYEDLSGERVFPKQRMFFDERKAARVNEAILPWLEAHHQQPFFVWLHYFDPHHPHEPPPPYNHLYVHDLYAGEIAYADESIGTIVAHLKRLGVYEQTLIVFTSDHGEGRGEHDESTHSLLAYNSTLHVPLIIKPPQPGSAQIGQRIGHWVGTVDVLPTVLDLLGLPIPDDIQGTSLRPELEGKTDAHMQRRPLYAETLSPRLSRNWGELRAFVVDDYKYIHGPRPELYHLSTDPKELNDQLAEQPEIVANLRSQLEDYLTQHAVAGLDSSVTLEKETLERLQSLGYLHGAGARIGPIDEILRDDGDPPQDHAGTTTMYSHAKNLLFQRRGLEAREFIRDLLKSDPDNPHYLELLVNAELQVGRSDEALAILDRLADAPAAYPPLEQTLTTAAAILSSRGEIDAAYEKYRDAEAIKETAHGQYRLAKIHELRQQPDETVRFLTETLELDPSFVPARLDLAVWHAQHGELDTAETHFTQALTDHPYMARTFYNYGTFLVQTERSEAAVDYFRRAAELRPNYLQAHYALVELLLLQGDRAAAQEHAQALSRLAPDSTEALLANVLLEVES